MVEDDIECQNCGMKKGKKLTEDNESVDYWCANCSTIGSILMKKL